MKLPKSFGKYWSVYTVCLGVWLSGAVWLVLHYFFTQQGDFGIAHHPMEHWSLVAHGAFAFSSLWMIGFLWGTHFSQRWRLRRNRKTGGLLFSVMCLLIVTGYLLYYLSSDELRASTAVIHWIIGLGMPLTFLGHWLVRRQ